MSDLLEFMNGSRIEVNVIFGGPVNVNGIIRDVLSIEINPKSISLTDLQTLFDNPNNLAHLYTYELECDDNDIQFKTKIEIGEGYTILLGIEEVDQLIQPFPGKITKPQSKDVYIVTIAQMTYDEWMNFEYDESKLPPRLENEFIKVGELEELSITGIQTMAVKNIS